MTKSTHRARSIPRSGFSIIELLVIVGVAAVILAITIPALRGVKNGVKQTSCINNARECARAVLAYAGDHDSTFPVIGSRDSAVVPAFENGGVDLYYFEQTIYWTVATHSYLGESTHGFISPVRGCPDGLAAFVRDQGSNAIRRDQPRGYVMGSDFRMSAPLISDPIIWCDGARVPDDRRVLRPVRDSEVRHASDKAMLIEVFAHHVAPDFDLRPQLADPDEMRRVFTIAMCDGSAGAVSRADLTPGIRPRIRIAAANLWIRSATPALTTRDGVEGRDHIRR